MTLLLVAIGGALGSMARYSLVGLAARLMPPDFPFGTFLVNVSGSLIFGLIVGVGEARGMLTSEARAFVLVGVLGGFTTFSSYSYDTFALVRDGAWTSVLLNSLGQVILGLGALAAGHAIGRLTA
jgi:fluoride exporter